MHALRHISGTMSKGPAVFWWLSAIRLSQDSSSVLILADTGTHSPGPCNLIRSPTEEWVSLRSVPTATGTF